MKPRRGFTLIELVAVITVMGALAGLTIMLLQLMLTSERTSRLQFVDDQTIVSLAESLRRDVRAAVSAEVPDNEQSPESRLVLNMDNAQTVEYAVARRQITRTRSAGERTTAREAFGLRRLVDARFKIESDTTRKIATLQLTRGKPEAIRQQQAVRRSLHIDAVVAADHRWNTSSREEAANENE